ncbi:MAG: hypothetical protein IPK75_18210 [Acidobacteria bacterium]|nr:hypothetical protein [Acidobacteriota bacterium]
MNIRPTTLILTLAPTPQDGRDLYREQSLTCACCGNDNRRVTAWVIPGLCVECAIYVISVTVAAPHTPPRQAALFDRGARLPG